MPQDLRTLLGTARVFVPGLLNADIANVLLSLHSCPTAAAKRFGWRFAVQGSSASSKPCLTTFQHVIKS